MSMSGTRAGRAGRLAMLGALAALACALPLAATGAVYVSTWRDAATSGWWAAGDGDENRWYRFDDGWDVRREDLATGQWSSSGTKNPNAIVFANANQPTMTVNAQGGAEHQINQIWFSNSTSRTFSPDGGAYLRIMGDGTSKIEAASGSGTGTYTFNVPLLLAKAVQLNPVAGNLTFSAAITNGGNWIDVYGNAQKTLTIGGVLSGGGGIAVKQDSIVVLTNDNTFTGAIWVEKGTVQLNGSTNAMGASGIVNVGTNATLDLQYGGTGVRPFALNLYGTGTNAAWGALRKTTTGSTTLRSVITLGADSRVVSTAGGFSWTTNVVAGGHTLYLSNNAATVNMTGGEMTGSKTTGDGALHKSGNNTFLLRPGSGLTGSILLTQGEIRHGTGNADNLPAGGVFALSEGVTYRSDGTTSRTNAKATRIDGGVTLGYSGGGRLTFSGNVNLNAGQRALTTLNDITISGAITNGGLTKAGSGTMVLLGANTYALGTLISAGVLQVGSNGTAGSISGNVTNNAALVFHRTDAHTFGGSISGTGALTNLAGTVTMSGTSTMSGPTTVAAGTLLVSGALGSSAVTVGSGATLAGAGTVGGLTVNGTVSPGNSAGARGTLSCGALTLGSGGGYTFDISNAAGTPGTDWDLVSGSGVLTVNGSGTFTIHVVGNPAGFSSGSSYAWTIMGGSSVSGFDAARFAVNTNNFTAPTAGGVFSVAQSGNNVQLVFTPSAPVPPADLAASDGTSTAHVALSWGDVAGETGFVIWRHTANVFGSATAIRTNAADTLTYEDTGAAAGQLYYYWVTATNTTGSSAESASDAGHRRLSPPGNVAATDGSSTANVTVTWDAAAGASTYHVYRDTDSDPAGATALGPQSSGFADTPTPGQLYHYWVLASNSTSSSTSDWSVANTGYRKLPTVVDVAATDNLSDKVTVTWTDSNAGETGYTVWRSDDADSGNAAIVSGAALGANAVSYDDTTATAGQTYHYWVRATNSTSASMGDFGSSDTGMKTLTEPTTPASAITFGDLATDSLTVGWTRGDGDYVLVVARQGAAPDDPTDGVVYGADPIFGLGDTTAAGSHVVYKGTGTSVPVTGLSTATEYYFAVYEFNGAATPNYRTHDEPVSNRFTLAAEPTTQASSILITGTNEVTLTGINWTDGNGASRIVVAKAGAAVDSFPVDGAAYTANAAFGSGTQIGTGNFVVHAGSGPLATLSGLTRDVVYHFRVFEFNGSGQTANYLTSAASGNPANSTTMAANPTTAATDLAISAIGTNGFTVSWTKGTLGTNTLIVIRAGGNPSGPTDLNIYTANAVFGSGSDLGSSSFVVYTGTGASVAVTNLVPGTRYYVGAYAFNGSGGSQNYRTSDPATTDGFTLMPEPAQATSLAFGTLGSTSYAVSYTAGGGLSRLVVAKAGGAVDWFPADGTAYTGENNAIGSAQDLGGGNFLVHRGASPFTLSGLSAATAYHIRVYEFQGTNTTLNYNTNAASGNPGSRHTLSTEPSAHAATFAATALSDTQIKLDWGAATGESGFIIVRKTGSAPTGTPADGTAYAQGNAIGDGTVVHVTTAAGASSVTDSYSTAAGTVYHYQIFPYAYDGTPANATYNYRTAASVPAANATTGPAEPATSSTLISFLPASGSSATIIWTNTGSADGTIILVKSNAAVNSNPTDWTGYAANTVFGDGDEIGTGNFVVVAGAGKHGSATITGLSAGTTYHVAVYPYNGSGAFLNYRTTSPATGSVVILPDPSAATATADGKTLIDLAWTKHASYDVMIVYKAGSASTPPTQGTGYNAGDAAGGGTVIYKGSGSALEHVVASGTTHHYAFYSYSGNYYSAGLTDSEATTSFAAGEIVETFSYTNGTALTGLNGETGWGGAWSVGAGSFAVDSGSFATQTNYPAMTGNKLKTTVADSGSSTAFRALGQTYTDGRLYFGYVMNYQYEGAGKYEGLSLYYGTAEEKLFVGEIGSADQQLGIDSTGSATALTRGSGNDYVIVGYYCWTNGMAYASAYKIGTDAVPVDEPSSWNVSVAKASNTVGWVNTVRLAAGATSGGTPGDVYFDEVRIATNWAGIVLVAPSKPDGDPTNQTATTDGSEMVRLAWTKNGAGNDVMVVHKTAAISTDPTDGTAYSAGNSIDGGRVVYKGAATALEHVVEPGTTNFYKFYSVNAANYYSTGVVAAATNAAYAAYEKVNPFSYTNDTAFGTSMQGGQGFGANYWAANSGTWKARTNNATAAADVPKFLDMTGYPAMAGNLAWVENPGDGGSATADRDIASTISTGNFYVAFMMSYQYYGANKWAGLSLMNGGTEKAFFGKGGGANWHTLAAGGDGATYWSGFDLLPFHSTGGETGNVYLIVGKYNFGSKLLQTKAWKIIGNEFPGEEPSSWDASGTLGTGIDQITRIRLNVGASTAGDGTIGRVFFDEIRYGTEWSQLIAVTCPIWAGSNTLSNTSTWLGDIESFSFQSYPPGLGQSGGIEIDWARNATFSTYLDLPWLKNDNNNSYWSNQVQMVSAGVVTSRFVASGSSCAAVRTNNPAITVQNLNPPTDATATRDGVNTNSQINLAWTRGISGGAKDVLVVRQTADSGWTTPVNGATYNAGDALGGGTVVYRGSGTTASDAGLAPDTTYYYRFYSENWTYYSVAYGEANASTATGTQEITVDGNPADWRGTASTVLNSAASSLQEYIWTDKRGETRTDSGDYPNADITEFRVYADSTWVYFLVKMTNITDVSKPFIAIGVDTRTNPASAAMNWLGDDSGTFLGGGYFGGGQAAVHFPEYQLNVHHVGATTRIETYKHDGNAWYAPPTGGNETVAISTAHNAIELKVARADLNLAGTKVGRFTVASYLNTGSWNNDGDGTVQLAANTADAVDAISIAPWGVRDDAANLSAWLEDISDADIDFWVDVKFAAGGLSDNAKPATPALTTPTNTAAVTASPTLGWQVSSDSDGQVTGYLLEISTNEQFNGVSGTENGAIDLRVNLDASTTNYVFTTTTTQYWWRVRARDTAGELSAATTRSFRVVGKLDTEGPRPTLLYIGTNVAGYLAGQYDARIAQYGPIQSVLDSEISDTNNVFGFVLRWEDPSGVFATNRNRDTGGFAYNIVDTDGRVSPNWDLIEIDTVGGTTNDLWGVDRPFYATNTMAAGNADPVMTNYVMAAFTVTNYNPSIEYYLTVSAEDAYAEGGSWWAYGSWPSFVASGAEPYHSGWCEYGPNTSRNITTNFLIRIQVTDDDIVPPSPSQALGWANEASLVVSNAAGPLEYVSGTGQDVLYQITDGALIGEPLSFSFNAYDPYYMGVALGTNKTYVDGGRTLTNTAFVAAYWQTNWANYDAAKSLAADTLSADTMMTWHWNTITTQDVTKLWGPDSLSGDLGVTNLIQLDLFDIDNDRAGDQASARVNFGRIVLVDDDAVDPVIDPDSLQVTGTGLASEYRLENLVQWTFDGSDPARLTSTNVAAGVTSSPISLNTGSIQGTGVITVQAGYATGADRWWLFTLTPGTTSETFKATSISFDSRVSSLNGPDIMEIYGTMPGGAETLWATLEIDLSDSDNPVGTNWNAYSSGLAMPAAATNTVQFKIRAYVADTNHLTGTAQATWSIDNLIVSGYVLGQAGGTQVTDRDLARGTVRFQALMHDAYSGLFAETNSGRAPRVDFWHATGLPVTNGFFTNGLASNGAARTATTVWGHAPPADRKQIQGGRTPTNYTARFMAEDYDIDRDGDSRVKTNTLAVQVYDNDTNAPARGFKYGGPLGVFVDGTITKAISSGFTREYRITDEQLQTASSTSITVKVNLYDFSGWEVPTLSVSNALAGVMSTNPWLTGLHTTSVNTTNNPDSEMVWTLSKTQADTFFNSYESTVNVFRVVSVWDKDDDRQDGAGNNIDNKELAGARLGHLTFIDNDVGQPNVQSSYSAARTNWNIPKVYLGLPAAASSNLLVNGESVLDTNVGTVALANLTNRVYDSQLAKVSAAAPLSVVLPAYDTGGGGGGRTIKGVQRGTVLVQASTNGAHNITNSWIGIGTVKVQNASAYRADLSSPLSHTRIAAQFPTSTWAFSSFSYAEVGQWLNAGEASATHAMTAGLYDADDNRPGDQRSREVALGSLRVLDNDTVAPSKPANVAVNGVDTSGGFDRFSAPWTNRPDFRVSFEPSVDGEPAGTDLEKTGVGEHRVAKDKADIGPSSGVPLAVAAESSLANYGFESGSTNWTLTGAEISTEQAYEGLYSLKMTGSTAVQTVPLVNTNGYVPRVTVVAVQYMGATDGTLTVDGLDTNGVLVPGETFDVEITGSAGEWGEESSATTELDAAVDQIRVMLTSGAGTYWDDVRVQIELLDGGSPVDQVTSIFSATEQGLVTNYLFAVDRDNNRPGDRLASSAPADPDIPSFITAYDITPPTLVPMPANAASTDTVDDPTTQFDIVWNPATVGPDDLDDENHPDWPSASDRDLLSPWRSYKIYYGTFDPLEVPGGDPGPGNGGAYIYTNFIVTGAYSNWLSVSATNAIADPSAAGTNYLAMTNLSQGGIRLYDLDFDQDYAVILVGLDKAGNEGKAGASSWATNNTIKFAVTQGVMRARTSIEAAFPTNNNLRAGDKGAAALYWIAAGTTNAQGGYTQVNREYDLIYRDARAFQEGTNWQKVGTIQSNWFTDAEAQDLGRGTQRFYRASYKDRWRTTNALGQAQRPLASEEVYALHNLVIAEGYNHVGLHGVPYTNTFAGVFGTDTNFWPGGVSAAAAATKIEFYAPSSNAAISEVYFFGVDGNWYQAGNPTPVTSVLQASNFFARGFSITLPSPLPSSYVTTNSWDANNSNSVPAMVWRPILQVPTNGFTHTIATGEKDRFGSTTLIYNLLSLNLPVSVHPSELNLPTNFVRGAADIADEIYTIDTTRKTVRDGKTLYCNAANEWRFVDGNSLLPTSVKYFKPNDVLVIVSRNGGVGNSWTWSYHPSNFYTLPTRWMGQ
jgi:autotransporter-associated beta strand protein